MGAEILLYLSFGKMKKYKKMKNTKNKKKTKKENEKMQFFSILIVRIF
jgi:hypothetical protein